MRGPRRWWQRYLELFVMEVRRPDGSTYLVALDSSGFGYCWLPVEVSAKGEDDTAVAA